MRELNASITLPLERQWGENHNWENSLQCHTLDSQYVEKEYFSDMDFDELVKLIRKMDNFFDERGISTYFFRNFALADQVFREKCDEE